MPSTGLHLTSESTSASSVQGDCRTLPLGSVGYEAETNERGEREIWLEDAMADRRWA
jgi:hypothetical protein